MAEDKDDIREEFEEEEEDKKKSPPWWQTIPSLFVVIAGILMFFAFRGMMEAEGTNNQYLLFVILIIGVLFIIGKSQDKKQDFVTPKEAELLTEREIKRKIAWGQFPLMTKYKIGPVGCIIHRDAAGMYHAVGVQIIVPFQRVQYFISTVMMSGPERAFSSLQRTLFEYDGRVLLNEKTIIPEWMRRSKEYPMLEKLFGKTGGF